jgi:hypothetical protein
MANAAKEVAFEFRCGRKTHYVNYVMDSSYKLANDPDWGRRSALNVQRILIRDIIEAERLANRSSLDQLI